MSTVAETIRKKRAEKDWSLRRLAEESGVSKSFVHDIESGRKDPSLKSLRKISRALDIDLVVLSAAEGKSA